VRITHHPLSRFSTGVQAPRSDLRRAISRQAWLANRAANALHRPAFIGAISVATFVTALVSMVVVPRQQRRAPVPVAAIPRPDTLSVIASAAMAQLRIREADSALAVTRQQMAAESARIEAELLARQATDTAGARTGLLRDSIESRLNLLDRLLARAGQAPLPSSYRAFTEVPELAADVKVRALLDTLGQIERERENFGAVGGVDPVFVALTSRASEIGRTVQAIAGARRTALRAQLAALPPEVAELVPVPETDTATLVRTRDSARAALATANADLERRRDVSRTLDLDEERARERAAAVAPPLALLAAAFVLSAVVGFGAAFFGELRRPRLANAQELERFLGVRALASVETPMPSAERGRREADRVAPPYFDPGAEGYQLAYLGLVTDQPTLLAVTVTGDDPAIVAVVACNLAAVAADEARHTLVLDLDPACSASAALRARATPGLSDVIAARVGWPDAIVTARVGRDKTVDLVPHGTGRTTPADAAASLRAHAPRLAKYYDALVVAARAEAVLAGVPAALPAPDVVYCAQPGVTPLRELRQQLDAMRAAGAVVRGVLLWAAERPLLPTPRELAAPRRGERPARRQVALAST